MAIGPRLLSAALVYWLRAQPKEHGSLARLWSLVPITSATQGTQVRVHLCSWQSGLRKGAAAGEALQAIALWALLQGGRLSAIPHSRQKSLPSFLLSQGSYPSSYPRSPEISPSSPQIIGTFATSVGLVLLQKKVIVPDA